MDDTKGRKLVICRNGRSVISVIFFYFSFNKSVDKILVFIANASSHSSNIQMQLSSGP